mmetsp:Transcript_5204/g.13203  ORF Transcript_5204/g.13203 Transcript_5204/m.13203 type:complete len:211 (-) Transcript_5204:214-846(-)
MTTGYRGKGSCPSRLASMASGVRVPSRASIVWGSAASASAFHASDPTTPSHSAWIRARARLLWSQARCTSASAKPGGGSHRTILGVPSSLVGGGPSGSSGLVASTRGWCSPGVRSGPEYSSPLLGSRRKRFRLASAASSVPLISTMKLRGGMGAGAEDRTVRSKSAPGGTPSRTYPLSTTSGMATRAARRSESILPDTVPPERSACAASR